MESGVSSVSNKVLRRLTDILTTLETNPCGLSAKELSTITGYPEAVVLKDLNDMCTYTDLGSYFTLYSEEDAEEFTGGSSGINGPDVKWNVSIGQEPYPALSLSPREAIALMWLFTEFPPPTELHQFRELLESRLFPGEEVSVTREKAEKMHAKGGVALDESKYVNKLREAILNENKVIIKYYAKNWEQIVQWQIWPLGLVFHTGNGVWYLLALQEDTGKIVACHCERIQSLQVLEERFEYPENFSLHGYLRLRWGMDLSEPETVRVRFYNEANVIEKVKQEFRSRGLPEPVPVGDGSLEYHGKILGVNNFSKWLLSLGSSAEVLEPEWLRQDMIRIASEWCVLYGGQG